VKLVAHHDHFFAVAFVLRVHPQVPVLVLRIAWQRLDHISSVPVITAAGLQSHQFGVVGSQRFVIN